MGILDFARKDWKIILGSKSPRRKALLSELGFSFETRVMETDESFPLTLPSEKVAEFIANQKATALIDSLSNDEILICADTIVVIDQQILGKPETRDQAIQMLQTLSGRSHKVITGVVVQSLNKKTVFSVTTEVHFQPLSTEIIHYYIDEYKPYDKAGSYGIQEWIGSVAVQKIEGSFNNVVGLPTLELYNTLLSFQ
jgi:septum formation protein